MFKSLLFKVLGFFCKDNLTKSKTISKYYMFLNYDIMKLK